MWRLAPERARVAVHGRQTDQGRDLLAIELAEFGKLRQQRAGGRRPHALDRGQQFGQVGVVSLDMRLELVIDIVQLRRDGIHDRQDAGLGLAVGHAQALGARTPAWSAVACGAPPGP